MNSDRVLWGVVIFAVVSAGGFFYWIKQQQTEPVELQTVVLTVPAPAPIENPVLVEEPAEIEEPAPIFTPAPEQKIVLPPNVLDGSDVYVRKAITDLAPSMKEWVIGSQQVRKWVLMIDLMADGQLMKQDHPLNYPMSRYEALPQSEDTYLSSPENYSRLSLLINVIVAVDVDFAAYYYQKWLPLLDKAYQELGKKGSFHGRVKKSMDRLIQVKPLIENPILIKKGGVMYRYVDDKYESATDIEKLVWRMGPENSKKLQDYLKRLRSKLPQ